MNFIEEWEREALKRIFLDNLPRFVPFGLHYSKWIEMCLGEEIPFQIVVLMGQVVFYYTLTIIISDQLQSDDAYRNLVSMKRMMRR